MNYLRTVGVLARDVFCCYFANGALIWESFNILLSYSAGFMLGPQQTEGYKEEYRYPPKACYFFYFAREGGSWVYWSSTEFCAAHEPMQEAQTHAVHRPSVAQPVLNKDFSIDCIIPIERVVFKPSKYQQIFRLKQVLICVHSQWRTRNKFKSNKEINIDKTGNSWWIESSE